MSINKALAEERGISQEDQDKIEELHNLLENLISSAVEEGYPDEEKIVKLVHDAEHHLKEIWGFDTDNSYHPWTKKYLSSVWLEKYLFRNRWAFRKFKCLDTGIEFVIPPSVNFRDLFEIGNGFLDVGEGYYFRKGGNVVEII